jgi:hypothetical protein
MLIVGPRQHDKVITASRLGDFSSRRRLFRHSRWVSYVWRQRSELVSYHDGRDFMHNDHFSCLLSRHGFVRIFSGQTALGCSEFSP